MDHISLARKVSRKAVHLLVHLWSGPLFSVGLVRSKTKHSIWPTHSQSQSTSGYTFHVQHGGKHLSVVTTDFSDTREKRTAHACLPCFRPFSSPEPTILLACGRNRELWEQPFWNNKGNNRILPIRFNSVFIYGACPKWLLPELLIAAAGQKDRRLWGREWYLLWPCTCTCHYYTVDLLKYLTSLIFLSIFFDLTYSLGRNSFKLSQGKQNNSMLLSAIHIVCAMARIEIVKSLY